jgi:hypothetical protein
MPFTQTKASEETVDRAPQQHEGRRGKNIAGPAHIKYLRIGLRLVGITFIFGIYTLTLIWPSGWSWHMGSHTPHYLQMILGVCATLGVFLLVASRNPLAHLSLIWFAVWSSVVHAGIMGAQALANPEHVAHLWGDVPALLAIAGVLAFLTQRAVARLDIFSQTNRCGVCVRGTHW